MRNGISLWKHVIKPIFSKGYRFKISKKHDKVSLSWTIVDDDITVKELRRGFNQFHGFWKYRLVLPLGRLLLWLQGPARKTTPRKHRRHDKNFVAFETAWDLTEREWVKHYYSIDTNISDEKITARLSSPAIQQLRFVKNTLRTIALWDTAYREFANMLLLNLVIEMNKAHDRKIVPHAVYRSQHMNDKYYFAISEQVIPKIEAVKSRNRQTFHSRALKILRECQKKRE